MHARMKTFHTLAIAVALPTVAGCFAEPLQQTQSNNPEVQVDLLFTHDGCKVYRFKDGGFHYFVKCDGAPTVTTMTPRKGGDEEIPTVQPTPL
jgi:hypothetical protein